MCDRRARGLLPRKYDSPKAAAGQFPISYEIIEEGELIRAKVAGYVPWEEITDCLQRLKAGLGREAPLDVLLDLTHCKSLPERTQLEGLASDIKSMGSRRCIRHCAIIASQPALFGMARMFEVLAEDQFAATRVFWNAAEAEAWLMQAKTRQNGG